MASAPGRKAFLDRPAARVMAGLVFLACLGALAYLERERFLPAAGPEQAAADDPFARCYRGRVAEIERMVEEGMVGEEQARLFRERAEAMCRAEAGGGGSTGPALPPPQ